MRFFAIATVAVLALSGFSGNAFANNFADQKSGFDTCMTTAGFTGDDFKSELVRRAVAGVPDVVTGFRTRVRSYVKTNPDLLGKYNGCRKANGLKEVSAS